jgi:hypothetical protein
MCGTISDSPFFLQFRLLESVQMNGYGRDQALICENGHVLNEYAVYHSRLNRAFCEKCGSKAIDACPSCSVAIPGGYTYTHDWGSTFPNDDKKFERGSYCTACGASFPWTDSALDAGRVLADEIDDLSVEERDRLKKSFEEIARETPQAEVAATRIKKIMTKVGGEGAKSIGRIAQTLATQAAKDIMFGPGG